MWAEPLTFNYFTSNSSSLISKTNQINFQNQKGHRWYLWCTSLDISLGKNRYGKEVRRRRVAAIRNPNHQAPTHLGSSCFKFIPSEMYNSSFIIHLLHMRGIKSDLLKVPVCVWYTKQHCETCSILRSTLLYKISLACQNALVETWLLQLLKYLFTLDSLMLFKLSKVYSFTLHF